MNILKCNRKVVERGGVELVQHIEYIFQRELLHCLFYNEKKNVKHTDIWCSLVCD